MTRSESEKILRKLVGIYQEKWIGKIMTIKKIFDSVFVTMEEDQEENGGIGWVWGEEDLEKVD